MSLTPISKLENKQSPRGPAISGSSKRSFRSLGKVPTAHKDNQGKPLVASSKVKPRSKDVETKNPGKGIRAIKKNYMLSSDGVVKR